jgi:hypothetical protein
MPISNTSFVDPKDPVSKLQKLMKVLGNGSIEAYFTDAKGEKTLSREFIEMAFQDYAIAQQNPQVMNKWISLDTKLDKNLLEYVSDVKMLIASVTQTGMAQQSASEPINMPNASPSEGMGEEPTDNGITSHDRQLPVTRER